MPFKIKLCGITKRIIDKYRREVAGTNLVLPVPDIAYCNRILKRIAVEVGIDKAVTYHLARHYDLSFPLKINRLQKITS